MLIDPDQVRESMRSAIERVRKRFADPFSSEAAGEPESPGAEAEGPQPDQNGPKPGSSPCQH
jgi:hypothetical protein